MNDFLNKYFEFDDFIALVSHTRKVISLGKIPDKDIYLMHFATKDVGFLLHRESYERNLSTCLKNHCINVYDSLFEDVTLCVAENCIEFTKSNVRVILECNNASTYRSNLAEHFRKEKEGLKTQQVNLTSQIAKMRGKASANALQEKLMQLKKVESDLRSI